jgi:hypothetical protein
MGHVILLVGVIVSGLSMFRFFHGGQVEEQHITQAILGILIVAIGWQMSSKAAGGKPSSTDAEPEGEEPGEG